MKKLPAITVYIAPHVLTFLQAYARRMTEDMQREGSYVPGDEVSVEAIASILLEQAAQQLMGPAGDTRAREEQQ